MQGYARILSHTYSLSKMLVNILYYSLERRGNGSIGSIDIDRYLVVIDNSDLQSACLPRILFWFSNCIHKFSSTHLALLQVL